MAEKRSDSVELVLLGGTIALVFVCSNVWGNLFYGAIKLWVERNVGVMEADVIAGLSQSLVPVLAAIGIVWLLHRYLSRQFEEKIRPKLNVEYDRSNPNCDSAITFGDGTKSRCVRLRVENTGTARINGCEGWATIKEFPNISAFRLYWAGPSNKPGVTEGITGAVDLIKGVPRFVQVFRIHEINAVIPSTEGEVWPIDAHGKFAPGKSYQFDVALKGDDDAETVFLNLNLNWTGNWQTSTVIDVTQQASA